MLSRRGRNLYINADFNSRLVTDTQWCSNKHSVIFFTTHIHSFLKGKDCEYMKLVFSVARMIWAHIFKDPQNL